MDTIEKALRKSGEPGSGRQRGAQERDLVPPHEPVSAEAPQEPSRPESAPSNDTYQELSEERLRRNGFLSRQDERNQLAEEFRIIKRPILENAFGPPSRLISHGNLVMVTSAAPSEGKTYCSINLALSIAREVNRTVLLVDADVARPALPGALGLGARLGLLDVLLDQHASLPDVLIRTNIPNLSLLPAGGSHRLSTELLASEGMARLVMEMSERYPDRIIIFDSPPLLATSEASVLASHMGQVLLVVESERTPASAVERALEQLEPCEVVLTLLNKARGTLGSEYGYSYYGGYGN